MNSAQHDLMVIGAGPGGYVAAIRAAQLGLKVGIVEKEPVAGGTCLRVGCIPSKALLESSQRYREAQDSLGAHGVRVGTIELDLPTMLKRKEGVVSTLSQGVEALLKKNGVVRYRGHGRIKAAGKVAVQKDDASTEVEARHIIIATGSKPASLPGITLDGDRIGTSTEALGYPNVPKELVVIGAGYIGLELGSVWQRLGSKVTVLEYLDRILPGMDSEIAAEAQKIFAKQGIAFRLGVKVSHVRLKHQRCVIDCADGEVLECDRVLVAIGRVPNTDELGLEPLGIKPDSKGRIPVQKNFSTSVSGIYAIGDVIAGPMLAHKAEEEGVACVEGIAGGHGHVNYDAIPGIVYTQPEIGTVGKSEEELKAAKIAYKTGQFRFSANGRARVMGHTEGRVKILADAKTDRVLGVHIIGPHAGDLIAEAVTAITFGASSEDIARTCHAHPTLSETLREAALAVEGRAIHS